ncbi:DUF411 domain-containing protein [Brevundimonas fluminis]|uniref:DUF411 domain-containing protein n=1 Tax=Brevundimonas fluminis TaxID=2487274 RepID=UPI000F658520|nr:DUF411 domain-containing protein [Brevundimonas fluminis]
MNAISMSRRLVLAAIATVATTGVACAKTPPPRDLTVYKTPTCPCCDGWVAHMREAGFTTAVTVVDDLQPIRQRAGLPDALASCHTGMIGGYVVEGHVPAADVIHILDQRPSAVGLTVPGMPLGSPGMETPQGRRQPYDTLLVLRSGETRVFARHNQPA